MTHIDQELEECVFIFGLASVVLGGSFVYDQSHAMFSDNKNENYACSVSLPAAAAFSTVIFKELTDRYLRGLEMDLPAAPPAAVPTADSSDDEKDNQAPKKEKAKKKKSKKKKKADNDMGSRFGR